MNKRNMLAHTLDLCNQFKIKEKKVSNSIKISSWGDKHVISIHIERKYRVNCDYCVWSAFSFVFCKMTYNKSVL